MMRRFSDRRGAIALIVALTAPVLIAITGLAVDVGYWYQQQESIQSAADAAAIAAANAFANYNTSGATAGNFTTIADNFAVQSANHVTNGQFSFSSSTVTVVPAAVTINGSASTKWTATVQIPRATFFSAVTGPGLGGVPGGRQYASASADTLPSSGCNGLIVKGLMQETQGAGLIQSTNCGVQAGSISTNSGSDYIRATSISAAGSASAPGGSSDYIGTSQTATSGGVSGTVTQNAGAVTDPMTTSGTTEYLGSQFTNWPTMPTMPGIPAMPAIPSVPAAQQAPSASSGTSYTNLSGLMGYTNKSGTWGSCTNYSGNCTLKPGSYSGLPGNLASLTTNQGNADGTTYISGGFNIRTGNGLTLNGDSYYILGGMTLSGANITINQGTSANDKFIVYGGASFPSITLPVGSYYFSGGASSGNSTSTTGLTTSYGASLTVPSVTSFTVYGGTSLTGTDIFGSGSYYFTGPTDGSGNATNYGLTFSGSQLSIAAGSSVYAYGGLDMTSGTVSFGRGTYYSYAPSGTSNSGLVFSGNNLTTADNSSFYVKGGMQLANIVTLGQGTYNISSANGSGTPSNWALEFGASGGTSLTMNGTAAAPSTYNLNGGMDISNGSVSIGNGTYYFKGSSASCGPYNSTLTAFCDSNSSSMTMAGGTFYMDGTTVIQNGTITFGPGTYEFYPPTNASGVATGWGLYTNATTINLQGSTFYVNGGMDLGNNSPTTTLSSGLYEFTAYSGNSNSSCTIYYCGSSGAFYAGQGPNLTFGNTPVSGNTPAPATYFFDGGLTIGGGLQVLTLNPGIYYIRNGNLVITAGTTVNGTGVTFVLEGSGTTGAALIMNGGAKLNISAPTSNCVATNAYPENGTNGSTDYVSNTPFDGTNGQGICDVAVYQQRGNTATDYINEGASSVMNGALYAPDATLSFSGAGSLAVTTSGIPAVVAAVLNDGSSGAITFSVTGLTGQSGGNAGSTIVLVN
ncbi:MAG: pilus assembly protein TadG-related protein [Acidocella sp.]|nr:pilus assembly protein TadG-related protein [Acidocella sp.]